MTIVERLYEAWNRHDLDALLAFFADDVLYHDQAIGVTFEGVAQLRDFVSGTFAAMPDLRFEVTNAFEAEGSAGAELIMRGRQVEDLPGLPAANVDFAVHYALIADVEDGRITRLVDYWNLTEFSGGAAPAPPRRPDFPAAAN